jgi:methylthioribose-1-phosphate isomerase
VIAPAGVPVYNPAFDITPHRYLTGIVTEEGVCYPPFTESLRRVKLQAENRLQKEQNSRSEGGST